MKDELDALRRGDMRTVSRLLKRIVEASDGCSLADQVFEVAALLAHVESVIKKVESGVMVSEKDVDSAVETLNHLDGVLQFADEEIEEYRKSRLDSLSKVKRGD